MRRIRRDGVEATVTALNAFAVELSFISIYFNEPESVGVTWSLSCEEAASSLTRLGTAYTTAGVPTCGISIRRVASIIQDCGRRFRQVSLQHAIATTDAHDTAPSNVGDEGVLKESNVTLRMHADGATPSNVEDDRVLEDLNTTDGKKRNEDAEADDPKEKEAKTARPCFVQVENVPISLLLCSTEAEAETESTAAIERESEEFSTAPIPACATLEREAGVDIKASKKPNPNGGALYTTRNKKNRGNIPYFKNVVRAYEGDSVSTTKM